MHVIGATRDMRQSGKALQHKHHIKCHKDVSNRLFRAFLCRITLGESKQVRVTRVGDSHNTGRSSDGCKRYEMCDRRTQHGTVCQQPFLEQRWYQQNGVRLSLITWRSTRSPTCGEVGSFQRSKQAWL